MTLDELHDLLKRWAREYGQRPEPLADGWDEGEGSSGYFTAHPLARAQEFAPGTAKAVLVSYRRDGSDRRRRMAEAVGMESMRVVGMAYVDPVPCVETRPDRRTPMYVSKPQAEEDVEVVQRHVMRMIEDRDASTYGHALQIHYCQRESLEVKAERLAERIGKGCTVRAYRAIVEQARLVLLGRMG